MKELVGSSHVVMAALAAGSIAAAVTNLTVQRAIAGQRKFVNNFANDITRKKLAAGTIGARATSYLLAAAVTFGVVEQAVRTAIGYTEARRMRTAAESCSGCIYYSGRWISIGAMPPIGSLQCRHYCRCFIEYR